MSNPLLTVLDYEARAREVMPHALFHRKFGGYGAPDNITNTNNMGAFEAIKLRPRVLVDVSDRELAAQALGQEISFPVMLAPTGFQQLAHPDGELGSARAAGAAGTIMVLSSGSNYNIEEVADGARGPLWFQTFIYRDRELTETLVRRAEKAGYTSLVLCVDIPGVHSREREHRYSYTHEAEKVAGNFVGLAGGTGPADNTMVDHIDPSVNWSDLEWLRSITSLPLVIKGIQTAEDARLCSEYGVDALIVSNHGGHAVQGTRGTVEMLPEVVDAAGDGVEVYIDGGIRRGTDVLKCMALGAKGVFIGRPMLWGLAVGGEDGVRRVLEILREEMDQAMGWCGVQNVRNADPMVVEGPACQSRVQDIVGQMERLAILQEKGFLTLDEFEAQKTALIGKVGI